MSSPMPYLKHVNRDLLEQYDIAKFYTSSSSYLFRGDVPHLTHSKLLTAKEWPVYVPTI